MHLSLKHHAIGSKFPPLKKNTLRIYSMHYCPYAERVRLVLAAKSIPHEIVNVNLVKKPDWFTSRTPHVGAVPVLEHGDGRIVYESLIICEYLDTIYPEHRLTPADPFVKAQHQFLVEMSARLIKTFYKLIKKNDSDSANNFNTSLDFFENILSNNFFGGEKEAMVDYIIWPWFERIPVLKKVNYDLDRKRFPKLIGWIENMKNLPAVKEVLINPESNTRFLQGFIEGNIDYDFELD